MKLYVKSENSHFDGFLSGVIIDEENNRACAYEKEGHLDPKKIDVDCLKWGTIKTLKISDSEIVISIEDGFYKSFYPLGVISL